MPKKKGSEIIPDIKKLTDAKIIMMSGYSEESLVSIEYDGFLAKPFGPNTTIQLITKLQKK
jgi:YesN/AraC family two-component response regulator